ncbi:MAG: YciI family protein [Dehalococcoidia bacterium]
MLYICMICYDPAVPRAADEPPSLQPEHADYERELRERGAYAGGAALMPVEITAPVRVRDGKVVNTDGPFAETKEAIGGYYVIDCKDLDEAVACAAKIPVEKRGWIEVRPVVLWHPK